MLDADTRIKRLAELIRQADYPGLTAYIAGLSPRQRAEPGVALKIAAGYLTQGEIRLARSSLAAASLTRATPGQRLRLTLEQAFADLLADAPTPACMARARAAWQAATGLSEEQSRLAEIPWRRVQLAAAAQFEIDDAERAQTLASLAPLATALETLGHIEQALNIRLLHAERQPATDRQLAALEALTHSARRAGFPALAGDARLGRARLMLAHTTPYEEIQAELDTAERLYASAGHRQGAAEVARLRAQSRIERHGASLEPLIACLAAFRQGRNRKGELSLLLDLSQMAHERGDLPSVQAFRQQARQLARRSGMRMTLNGIRLTQLDLLQRQGHYRAAIELANATLAETASRFMVASLEQHLGSIHGLLGQPRQAIPHTRRALEAFQAMGSEALASQAALLLAQQLTQQTPPEPEAASALLTRWQRRDLARGDTAALLAKLELQAQLFFGTAETRGVAHHLLDTAERLAASLSGLEAARRLGNLQQQRSLLAHQERDKDASLAAIRAAAMIYARAGLAMEAANCHYLVGVHALQWLDRDPAALAELGWNALDQALSYYLDSGMRQQSAQARYMQAKLLYHLLSHFDAAARQAHLEQALRLLGEGEADLDAVRSDFAAGDPLATLEAKRQLRQQSQRLYELALPLAAAHQPTEVTWRWAQRAKARALCDTLGDGTLLTGRLKADLDADPRARALAEQEHELVARRRRAPAAEHHALSRELETLRERMARHSGLHELLALRRGEPPSLASLPSLLAAHDTTTPGSLLVDWVAVAGRLHLMTLRPGEAPRLTPLPLSIERVAAFVRENLGPRHFRDTLHLNPALLDSLAPLVAPLAWLARPGERLILSPTGALHALPLHALSLQGEALIARHPVAYSPGLGILRLCLQRTGAHAGFRRVAVFGDPQGDLPDAALLVTHLAQRFATRALRGSSVTRDAFRNAIQGRDLIHYQGHARFTPDDPLASSLLLADGALTAREIFAITDLTAPLVTLAACESAVSEIAPGDEPLGLIPAFLQAGARAVLATLWRTHAGSGAQLIEHLHAALDRQGNAADLSQALQQAILEIRESPGWHTPYHR